MENRHTLSGIYSVIGSDFVETVYCDFAKLSQEQGKTGRIIQSEQLELFVYTRLYNYLTGYQTTIGFSDVKSSPVYFYVQKDRSQNVTGRIPSEVARLNIGGAI